MTIQLQYVYMEPCSRLSIICAWMFFILWHFYSNETENKAKGERRHRHEKEECCLPHSNHRCTVTWLSYLGSSGLCYHWCQKDESPVRMFSAMTLACTSSECSEVYVISALTWATSPIKTGDRNSVFSTRTRAATQRSWKDKGELEATKDTRGQIPQAWEPVWAYRCTITCTLT